MTGNLETKKFTGADLDIALDALRYMISPVPELMDKDLIQEAARRMEEVNQNANADFTQQSVLMWGITIGILAERNRVSRNKRKDR